MQRGRQLVSFWKNISGVTHNQSDSGCDISRFNQKSETSCKQLFLIAFDLKNMIEDLKNFFENEIYVKLKKINLLIISAILVFAKAASAINIECFENESEANAVHLFLSFVDNSQTVINFQESYLTPHPEKKWGFIFESIQQSQSSNYLFPRGVYSGTALTVKENELINSYGILSIEEEGHWSFSKFDYKYKGTYLFIDPSKTKLTPVHCRISSL